jgi:type III pantothenate kinase
MLLIDLGNYKIKCQDSETNKTYTAVWYDEKPIENWLDKNFKNKNYQKIIICSVAHIIIENKIIRYFKDKKVVVLKAQKKQNGLRNLYENYKQLGADRWVNAVGAFKTYPSPQVVIDCGSAISVDFIKDKKFYGGAIMCGLQRAIDALPLKNKKTWQYEASSELNTTNKCVSYGIVQGTAFAIDSFICGFQKTTKKKITCIVTGGDGAIIQKKMKEKTSLDKNLIWTGMKHICKS